MKTNLLTLVVLAAGTDRIDNFTVTAIPEPSTYALFAGLAGFAAVLWRHKTRGDFIPAV